MSIQQVAWSLMSEADYDDYLQEHQADLTPTKVIYHQDSGHGWFAVPYVMVVMLGISENISRYSYHDHKTGTAYLEEDCDVAKLVSACEDHRITLDIEERHVDGDHWIRSLPAYGMGEAWS
jgi:hypothetical protein